VDCPPREHEAGAKREEVCRRHGISSATFYKWKSKYGGLEVSMRSGSKGSKTRTDDLSGCWPIRCWTTPRYSSTKPALSLLSDPILQNTFLPILYFDDIVLPTYSNWAGELPAINEFNAEHEMRKIEQYRFLASRRIFKSALDRSKFHPASFRPSPHQAAHARRVMQNVYLNEFDSD
jgi:hypothetical protein